MTDSEEPGFADQPFGRWLVRGLVVLLIGLQGLVLLRTANDPSQSDFANYFVPAYRVAHGGNLADLYQRDGFDRAMKEAGLVGLGSFIPHPPANVLWLLPVAGLSPVSAKTVWSVALVLSLGLCVWAVRLLTPRHSVWVAALIVLAPTLAIRNGLAFGQPYFVLSAFLLFGVVALRSGRAFAGGFLLGLGVSFKPYALTIGFLFLHKNRRAALGGFAFGAVAPSLVLGLFAGVAPFSTFVTQVLPWMTRGEVQDPFSPGWGGVMALSNRLFRFEPDLNPTPWFNAPLLSRFLGSAVSAALVALGMISGRRAIDRSGPLAGVAAVIAFAIAASPFAASYHVVLLTVCLAASGERLRGRSLGMVILLWAVIGSTLVIVFRSADGPLAPLAFTRLLLLLILAATVSWPDLSRRGVTQSCAIGVVVGLVSLPWMFRTETWARLPIGGAYSAFRPRYCGDNLRWLTPSADGRSLESRGAGVFDCAVATAGPRLTSRFADGSWNIYLQDPGRGGAETRITFSDANEVDPVFTPDGCGVVFASDQGRGLGSTALYRTDVSRLVSGCERFARSEGLP